MNCDPDAGDNDIGYGSCPFLGSIYDTDPAFKKDLDDALKSAGLTGLTGKQGSLNGPDSGLIPVDVGGEKWLQGSVCERGNCGDHYLKILYIPSEHVVAGFYYNSGEEKMFGDAGDAEARILRRDVPDVTLVQQALAVTATPADGAPADTIWTFKGDGGKSLWQVCGGQNSSCTIIANTKYYVAILNRKSAHSCAFGDFYVAARDSSSWRQYDTGTCSPDAWIRKGSINNGQYLSVDIGVNNQVVQQYPIGYWSMKKEFSGSRRPSWSKVKEKNQQH
ncbi:inhibitor of vertebrate lysozyme family protein [Escherichia coli O5:H32]|uniref:inhibitor of vertebrate lysozyme family protein n=1 Tax=Escherichia coli TaxID=562 RepID=UPI000ABEB7FB|nr:inhibitor of vertebrate lysozyme family protein [Escherichia coli]